MTKKDYVMIAKVLNKWHNGHYTNTFEDLVHALMAEFAEDNPNFDGNKFIIAVSKGDN